MWLSNVPLAWVRISTALLTAHVSSFTSHPLCTDTAKFLQASHLSALQNRPTSLVLPTLGLDLKVGRRKDSVDC